MVVLNLRTGTSASGEWASSSPGCVKQSTPRSACARTAAFVLQENTSSRKSFIDANERRSAAASYLRPASGAFAITFVNACIV
jgi:hypothetical protein